MSGEDERPDCPLDETMERYSGVGACPQPASALSPDPYVGSSESKLESYQGFKRIHGVGCFLLVVFSEVTVIAQAGPLLIVSEGGFPYTAYIFSCRAQRTKETDGDDGANERHDKIRLTR